MITASDFSWPTSQENTSLPSDATVVDLARGRSRERQHRLASACEAIAGLFRPCKQVVVGVAFVFAFDHAYSRRHDLANAAIAASRVGS